MRAVAGVMVVVVPCTVPAWVGSDVPVYAAALSDSVLFLSLGLLVKVSGQVSLCQYGSPPWGPRRWGTWPAA
jgi:hypothetical protein